MPRSLTDLSGLDIDTADFLAAVLEAAGQPTWVVDCDGLIRFANPAALAALGYDRADELFGRHSHETIHYQHPDGTPYPAAECPMLLPRTTGEVVKSDLDWFFRRDGSMFPVSYVSVPLEMRDGRGAVVAFTDIEERLRADETVRGREEALMAQQASLRRVATLVAGGAASADVCSAIAREVGHVIGLPLVALWRYESDRTATVIGAWSEHPHPFQEGSRWPLDGPTICAQVLETGRPARIDDFALVSGIVGEAARATGICSCAGVPIIVDGEVWGAMSADSTDRVPLAHDIEDRLAEFTELVAAAIANTASQEELARLAEEQAALRRVATLVAREASQAEVFAAIAEECAHLFGTEDIGMVRYEGDRTQVVLASAGTFGEIFPRGSRQPLGGDNAASRVSRTGRPARIDDYGRASGPIAEALRPVGLRSAVATPIMVEGRLWGAMITGTTGEEPLPAETESRLGKFTELMATAIANTESHATAKRLTQEQAALRRVATLVAKESPPAEVFAKVAEELATVLGDVDCSLFRDEGDGTASAVALSGARVAAGVRVGARLPVDGDGVIASVLREGRPCRIGDYSGATGAIAQRGRELGIRSAVGCPVVVGGRIWGAMGAARYEGDAFPPETETRIGQFADLVATAIANADARAEVERLAAQQTALRRVATLVARESPPDQVFAAVAEELGRLLGADVTTMCRYEADETVTVVAEWGPAPFPAGTRVQLDRENIGGLVLRTGRPARVDDYATLTGSFGSRVRETGVRSSVACPIVVDGRLWGLMIAGSRRSEPLPVGTESRIGEFTELVATAISNVQSRSELAASRARLVAAADEEHRRVVRDLHDGAQQRLVHTIITLELARGALETDAAAAPRLVAEALDHAHQATAELRELAHDILPAALTRGGLRTGVDALASRMPVPVKNGVSVGRLPAAVESTAYFVVAEALTNVAKHAHAARAAVTAHIEDGTLHVQVRDDGIGGAQPDGSGLLGLKDRLAALNGQLRIEGPADGGTLIVAVLPVRG